MINKELRKRIVEEGYKENLGHYGSAFSCLDTIEYLHESLLKPNDIFIMSKGHAGMALYAVLEKHGKKPLWKEHPELDEENGIYASTGSLGHGLPIAVGRAYGKKLKGDSGKTYVLVGDGEMQEGSNWEALMIANKLDVNLNVLIDWNKYQSVGEVYKNMKMDQKSLENKLKAFGCKRVMTINGHTLKGLKKLNWFTDYGLNGIVLNTIKGKGVSLFEYEHPHVFFLNEDNYKKVIKELE